MEKALKDEKSRSKELESYLHKYYQKEMERIMAEKVKQLQKHIGNLLN